MNITFRQLRVFIAVAERGSVNRAAVALHLSAPAVSMQIREVEKHVGLSLFARESGRLSLSQAGEHFLVYAKRLLADLKEADNVMARFKRLDGATLTLGIMDPAVYFVPRLLMRFGDRHPGIDVKLRVATGREQLIRLLNDADVDLGVMARPPRDLAACAESFAAHPYVFVCPPRHALVDKSPLPLQALDGQPFIVRAGGSGIRLAMEKFLAIHRCTPRISMEIASNESIKQAVMAGMGLGFLSLHCIALELRNGLLGVLDIVDTPVMGDLNLVHLPSRILSPAAEAFRQFLVSEGEKHLHAENAALLPLAFKKRMSKTGHGSKSRVARARRRHA